MVHAFVPQHLLDFAEYLQKQEYSDENYDLQCIDRTIINRAYLSTYLHVQDWILNNGHYNNVKDYSKHNVGYHTAICIALTTLNKNSISKKYGDFIKLRVDADYNMVTIITPKDAQKAFGFSFTNPKCIAMKKIIFFKTLFQTKSNNDLLLSSR